MAEYTRNVKGGALKLKGGGPKKKKRKSGASGHSRGDVEEGPGESAMVARDDAGAATRQTLETDPKKEALQHHREEEENSDDDEAFQVNVGTGRISSSGATIYGYETKFQHELRVGDAILVSHPTTLSDETRIVKMILSDTSMAISSAFSSDLISTCAFRFVSAPREKETAETTAATKKRFRDAREDDAVGDYAGKGGATLVYRERKGGMIGGGNGYRIVTRRLDEAKSRTELLEMRVKYKSDRHCA